MSLYLTIFSSKQTDSETKECTIQHSIDHRFTRGIKECLTFFSYDDLTYTICRKQYIHHVQNSRKSVSYEVDLLKFQTKITMLQPKSAIQHLGTGNNLLRYFNSALDTHPSRFQGIDFLCVFQ